MVNCLLNRTLSTVQVSLSNCFHGVVMMHIILIGFLCYLFQRLQALVLCFRKILAHICHHFILLKNMLNVHICLPSFQANIKTVINNCDAFSDEALNRDLLILTRLCNNHPYIYPVHPESLESSKTE